MNISLAFTSVLAQLGGHGTYCFRRDSQLYQYTGLVKPTNKHYATFTVLYFSDNYDVLSE